MNMQNYADRLARLVKLAGEVIRLPVAHLHFDTRPDPDDLERTYRSYTKPHPRYKIFANKALGAGLIDLRQFASREAYLASINGKNDAGPKSRKAKSRGYHMREIHRNAFIEQIHNINVSCDTRQGRPMDSVYQQRVELYVDKPHYRYFGMFDKDGLLVAYCNIGIFGNFAGTEKLLGYKNNDGIMHLLLTEIVGLLIEAREVDYFMYDTMFGAKPGLREFKNRLGFRPYRVRYSRQ